MTDRAQVQRAIDLLNGRWTLPPRPSLAESLACLRRLPDPAPVVSAEGDGGFRPAPAGRSPTGSAGPGLAG
jgi:hypothetical protein